MSDLERGWLVATPQAFEKFVGAFLFGKFVGV